MFRSGLVGFTLHGSLSHFYYQFCEVINQCGYLCLLVLKSNAFPCDADPSYQQELFPFQDWWVVPAKVLFDQTLWAAVWNSIYYTVLGFLRFESPVSIFKELAATFWPMLTVSYSSALLRFLLPEIYLLLKWQQREG